MNETDNKKKTTSFQDRLWTILSTLFSVLTALLIGAILIWLSGSNPFMSYKSLLLGAISTPMRIGETLIKAVPMIMMGCAIAIAFRNSFWNIGGDGQLLIGAIAATFIGVNCSFLPTPVLMVSCFLAAFFGGAAWCLIAGFLKIFFNVNEILSTLMLNYIATSLLDYLIRGPMLDKNQLAAIGQGIPQSDLILENLYLPILFKGTRIHGGLIIAIIILFLFGLLWKTKMGFRIETVGANPKAARYAGIQINRTILLTSLLSGGIAGIVGWNEVFGIHHRLLDAISAGYGNYGVVVALLGNMSSVGILFSSLLFSVLVVGGSAMERSARVPFAIVEVVNGIIILFVLLRNVVKEKVNFWIDKDKI